MQIGIFDGTQRFVLDKPIRLISLFSGYDSQALALKYLGLNYEHYKTCEWAVKSIQALKDLHFAEDGTDYSKPYSKDVLIDILIKLGISANYNEPMTQEQIKRVPEDKLRQIYNNIQATHNLVNIQQAHGEDFEIVDTDQYTYVMTYSFPCGLAGTKVVTKNGYKNIEDVLVNDYVLTHNNRFCKVNKTMTRISNHYYVLKGLGVPELFLTEEHPLYIYRDNKFQWVKVKDLKITDMLSFNINKNSKDVELTNEDLWLLGRYVADGWINKKLYNSVEFAIGFDKENTFLNNIPNFYKAKCKKSKKSCWEYRIADKTLQDLCKQFGEGALKKCIPQWVIDLPKNKLQAFFDGYISGDGHVRFIKDTKQIMFSTVSEPLFLGLQQIIAKLYNCVCSCSIRHDTRKASFNDTYNCQFNLTECHRGQLVIGDKICTKLKVITRFEEDVPVYNFEVDEDNSYTCQNVIVHNCQDLSSAGLGKGMEKGSGTRSGMLWEVERILDELNSGAQKHLPQVLLMENVPEVIGTNNIKHFAKWLDKLESLGYKCYWQVLNGKDYGVPQNRERCFMVSLLGDYYYNFPPIQKLTIKLKDILEEKVDEKYYLSDRAINGVLNTTFDCSKLEHRTEKNGVMPTLCARDYKDPKLVVEEPNLKRQLCNHLIEKGIVQEGDVFKHSYSNNRLDQYYASNQSNHDCSPTLDTRCDCFGVVVNEPNEETYMGTYEYTKSDKFMNGRERFKPKNDIISTIQTSHSEGVVVNEPKCIGGIGEKKSNGGTQWYQQDRIYDDNIAISVTTTCNPYYKASLRIRKLTPKECFRLMGVKDADFDKVAQNQSNASLYHLAGDSIIVDVLMAIFKNMT